MLFKISIKYYITIIFSLFSFVKRYAVHNVKIRQYAVRRVKIRQYAVRKGEGGFHPHKNKPGIAEKFSVGNNNQANDCGQELYYKIRYPNNVLNGHFLPRQFKHTRPIPSRHVTNPNNSPPSYFLPESLTQFKL